MKPSNGKPIERHNNRKTQHKNTNNKTRKTPTDHVSEEGGVGDPREARHPLRHPAVLQAHCEGQHKRTLTASSTKHSAEGVLNNSAIRVGVYEFGST